MNISQILNEKSPSSIQRLFEFLNKGGVLNNDDTNLLESSALEEFIGIKNKKILSINQKIPKNSESLIYNFYTNFPTSERSLEFIKNNKTFITICNSGTDFTAYLEHMLEITNHHENIKIENLEKIIILSTIISSSSNFKNELIQIAKETGEIDISEFKENISNITTLNKNLQFSKHSVDSQLDNRNYIDNKLNTVIQKLQSKNTNQNKLKI